MSKSLILKIIVLPLALAVAIGIALVFIFNMNAGSLFPVKNGAQLAYYDSFEIADEAVNIDEAQNNSRIGAVVSEGELPLLYNADYSNLLSVASYCPQSALPDETGCVYIKVNTNNVAKISTSEPLTLVLPDSELTYEYTGEKLCASENEVLSLAPKGNRSLIVYYRVSRGIGVTSDYYALIYKGVE